MCERMRSRRRTAWGVALLAGLLVLPAIGLQIVLSASPAGAAINNYTAPSISAPHGITQGPDGASWFVNTNSIGRIDTAGAVTNFTDPSISAPLGIATGSDGALWFTNYGNNSIGKITTGGTVTNFANPSISNPDFITAGSDGALWFTNDTGSIGRISTLGVVTNYTDPSISTPGNITSGPDSALWFTNRLGNSIGRITVMGAVTSFTDPSISHPNAIAVGQDGALWFTNGLGNSIGRITTAGAVTHFTDPNISGPAEIAAGPDGALWFTNQSGSSIGRITTSGVITNYADPTISHPYDIAAGHDGALWFTNPTNNSVGRITTPPTPCGPACVVVLATPGTPVQSFSGPPTDAHPTKVSATLPGQAGGTPVDVTLTAIDPGPSTSVADRQLCPTTGITCTGQISVIAGDFTKYVSRAHPIQIQIVMKWNTTVPPGHMVMSKPLGPPVQLPTCIISKGLYNTPCAKPEVRAGSAAGHNLTTTDTVLFIGTDPHVGRRAANVPDAPTAVKALAGKKSAKLTWKAPIVTNGPIAGYLITPHLRKVALPSINVTGLKRTVTGLLTGKTYTFTVAAKNRHGISYQSIPSNAIKPK